MLKCVGSTLEAMLDLMNWDVCFIVDSETGDYIKVDLAGLEIFLDFVKQLKNPGEWVESDDKALAEHDKLTSSLV